jgi:hypothetical protein
MRQAILTHAIKPRLPAFSKGFGPGDAVYWGFESLPLRQLPDQDENPSKIRLSADPYFGLCSKSIELLEVLVKKPARFVTVCLPDILASLSCIRNLLREQSGHPAGGECGGERKGEGGARSL